MGSSNLVEITFAIETIVLLSVTLNQGDEPEVKIFNSGFNSLVKLFENFKNDIYSFAARRLS